MDNPRIEELKRRVQKDPASIAFAQLGEEYRRAGQYLEAIRTCCAGLARHPGYLSARVTLGRALTETGNLDQAIRELEEVLRLAPENLAALRGIADALHRRGNLALALAYYERALSLARGDADLQRLIQGLRGERALDAAASRPQAQPPAAPVDERSRTLLLKLERWLEVIVADRRAREVTGSRSA